MELMKLTDLPMWKTCETKATQLSLNIVTDILLWIVQTTLYKESLVKLAACFNLRSGTQHEGRQGTLWVHKN